MMPTLDWLFVDPFRVLRFAKSIVKQIYKLNTGYHKMIELSHKQFRLMFTLVAYFSCITHIRNVNSLYEMFMTLDSLTAFGLDSHRSIEKLNGRSGYQLFRFGNSPRY